MFQLASRSLGLDFSFLRCCSFKGKFLTIIWRVTHGQMKKRTNGHGVLYIYIDGNKGLRQSIFLYKRGKCEDDDKTKKNIDTFV